MILGPDGKPANPVFSTAVQWLIEDGLRKFDNALRLAEKAPMILGPDGRLPDMFPAVGATISVRLPKRFQQSA